MCLEKTLSLTFCGFFLSHSLMNIVRVLRTPMSVMMDTLLFPGSTFFFKRYILFISSYNSRFLHVHLGLNMTCFVLDNFGTAAQI